MTAPAPEPTAEYGGVRTVTPTSRQRGRGRRLTDIMICGLVPVGLAVTVSVVIAPRAPVSISTNVAQPDDLQHTVNKVNTQLAVEWQHHAVPAARPAEELPVFRRLSLALHGTVPSLEELRAFDNDTAPDRLARWTQTMLADRRFAEYFAERLARAFVGTDPGQPFIYRRDRLVEWLADQLHADTPYTELVERLIAEPGLWTGEPATNFVMAAYANEDLDENKLAGRVVRAFLGQRMDCAQCHDHPFDDRWKQSHFEGLAAFFGQTRVALAGVEDTPRLKGEPVEYTVEDRETLAARQISPGVPFGQTWLPDQGSRRQRLARWVTNPDNHRFGRATANRVWGLLFGRSYYEPVDAVPDPDPQEPDVLDVLADDWRRHDTSLKRLILTIVLSDAFRASSESSLSSAEAEQCETHWSVFPLVRLRPEQVVGSILQASSIRTIDQNSHILTRFRRWTSENDFIKEYGDLGESELEQQPGTIPQALQRMNGRLVAESIRADFTRAAASIQAFAPDSQSCVDTAFRCCLTRLPTAEEREFFVAELEAAENDKQRKRVIEDLFWCLFNSPEFAWNH